MRFLMTVLLSTTMIFSCDNGDTTEPDDDPGTTDDYTGTGSVTQGLAQTVTTNLLDCGRVAGIGTITSSDNEVWTVPAEVNYADNSFPFASNLHNPCNANTYSNVGEAIAALSDDDIVEIDSDGEVITAYVFADNYFEMYINGVAVGKDNVPFTQFNSDIVRFKVNTPFTIAMKLVDWEENLGLGSEANGSAYHPGDGGMVAVFKNSSGETVAITDDTWKAQTYYTAPIKDLSCLSESGTSDFLLTVMPPTPMMALIITVCTGQCLQAGLPNHLMIQHGLALQPFQMQQLE